VDIKQFHHWLEQIELLNNERLSLEAWKCLVSRCSRLSSLTLQLQDNSLGLLAVVAQSGRKLHHLEVVNAACPPIQEKLSLFQIRILTVCVKFHTGLPNP
jgi:hypothetical protein